MYIVAYFLNEVYGEQRTELDPAVAKMQFMSLPRGDW